MAFKRSAVRSRLSPPTITRGGRKPLKLQGFSGFSVACKQDFLCFPVRLIFDEKILNQGDRGQESPDPSPLQPCDGHFPGISEGVRRNGGGRPLLYGARRTTYRKLPASIHYPIQQAEGPRNSRSAAPVLCSQYAVSLEQSGDHAVLIHVDLLGGGNFR